MFNELGLSSQFIQQFNLGSRLYLKLFITICATKITWFVSWFHFFTMKSEKYNCCLVLVLKYCLVLVLFLTFSNSNNTGHSPPSAMNHINSRFCHPHVMLAIKMYHTLFYIIISNKSKEGTSADREWQERVFFFELILRGRIWNIYKWMKSFGISSLILFLKFYK